MKPEWLISWRYLVTKRKEKFISLISVISVLGVAIGVAALIVVIGVMTGFDKDLRDKIVGNYSHITIAGEAGIEGAGYGDLRALLEKNPHVRGVSPFIQGQVLIKERQKFFGVNLKGIDPASEPRVTKIRQYLTLGTLGDLKANCVFVGRELAAYLGLVRGQEITIYSPQGKQFNLKVAGIFTSGMYEYDLNLVFTDIKTAQDTLGLKDRFSAVAVKLDDLYLADKVKDELEAVLGVNYGLKTWTEANQNFFAALELEKFTMFIILALIVLVASFNIVSTLVVMVIEKTRDIGILKALGMSSAGIRKIFTCEGLLIGTAGTLLGTLLGVTLCGLLKKYQFIKLPRDIYYIDRLPVSLAWPDIGLIVASALAITLVATFYPARKAAGLQPVEALRYE
jgi:lipoprotein-releasing system permease protein